MQGETQTAGEGLTGRRLKEAVKYVSRTWFPVNTQVLKLVQDKLAQGIYANQKHELINDLKGDFSLLAFCLRKLETVIDAAHSNVNPMETLRKLEIDQLKAILSTTDNEISAHRFDEIRDIQALRLRHSIISCCTAEVLASKNQVDADFAFSCALLRQLGFMLVAWNYPGSFQKALAAVVNTGNDIEEELAKIIGFEPALLGYEVTLHWNNCPELRTALGWKNPLILDDPGFAETPEYRNAENVARFCELGEVLAQVNNQQHYPKAIQRWKAVEKDILALLKEETIKPVSDAVKEVCKSFISVSTEIFSPDVSPDQVVRKANSKFVLKLIEENLFIKRCPERVQDQFRQVYDQIVQGEVSTNGVNMLVGRVIPTAGFLRGCIFLVDNSKAQLVPRVRIGDSNGRVYKPVSCSASGDKSNPISEAFHCATPLKQERVHLHNDVVSHVCGKFGNSDKGGVLYLEMSETLLSGDNHTPVTLFKAIRQCLNHCLNLPG